MTFKSAGYLRRMIQAFDVRSFVATTSNSLIKRGICLQALFFLKLKYKGRSLILSKKESGPFLVIEGEVLQVLRAEINKSVLFLLKNFMLSLFSARKYSAIDMKNEFKRTLVQVTVMMVLVLLCTDGQAASFDCDKTTIKVEKIICTDKELSKLDEEMAVAYKTALQDDKQAETIRQTQKQWIKERNKCTDTACVKRVCLEKLQSLTTNGLPEKYEAGNKTKQNFSGQWHLELCDKSISEECGGFTVYLIQTGEKICGDHFFATPGGNRLNEGAPRSIVGSVADNNIANIIITSGRNGAVYRVRAIENGDTLNWEVMGEIKPGPEGDSALVLTKGNLERVMSDSSYQAAFSACQNY